MLATASKAIEAACLSLKNENPACTSVYPHFTTYHVQQQAAKMLDELCLKIAHWMTVSAMVCAFGYYIIGQAFYLRDACICMSIAVACIAAVLFQCLS